LSYTTVGRLNKSFGIKGMIKVLPEQAFRSDLQRSDVWFIQRGAEVVPYFVESIDQEHHFLVKFEDINSPEQAKDITGCPILLRNQDVSIDAEVQDQGLDKLVGFTVTENQTLLGTISRIEEYPQQLMAFVSYKEGEIMVPLTTEFILDINIDTRVITMNLPAGLVDSQL